jgi:type IV secretion system protein VirB10
MKNEKENGLPEIAQQLRRKTPIIVAAIASVLIAIFVMFFHSQSSEKIEKPVEETYAPQAQEKVEVKSEPVPATATTEVKPTPSVTPEMMQAQILLMQEKQKELQQRLSAPLMVVNNKVDAKPTETNSNSQSQSKDANTQFLNQISSQTVDTVNATKIGNLNSIIAEGSLIHATLESATNSDLPGYVRATVREASFSEDGSQVLIQPGSRLIGQYKSGMLQGQSRIYIVWSRLITPDGVSVNLGSPGVDSLGVAGMGADEIDRHFWERFGTASLLSLIGAGAANNGVSNSDQNNSASEYRAAVASSFAQSASQSLQQESNIAPTLKTYQGKPIMVFVAKDIHFERVMKQLNSRVSVF